MLPAPSVLGIAVAMGMQCTGSSGIPAPVNAGGNAEFHFFEGAEGLDFKKEAGLSLLVGGFQRKKVVL